MTKPRRTTLLELCRAMYRAIASLASGAILDLIHVGSRSTAIHDFRVIRGDRSATDAIYAPMETALRLVKATDSRRFARMRRDVARIYVVRTTASRYVHSRRAILLSSDAVLHWDPIAVAIILAHEATHARLESRGIPYSDRDAERIEQRCVDESIAFASLLPDGDTYVDWIRESMKSPWWTPRARGARMRADVLAAIRGGRGDVEKSA